MPYFENPAEKHCTILCAISRSRHGNLLVLWLMALLRMCFGRAPNTWELPVVFVTALNMALTSAALAFAKSDAGEWHTENERNVKKEEMDKEKNRLKKALQ